MFMGRSYSDFYQTTSKTNNDILRNMRVVTPDFSQCGNGSEDSAALSTGIPRPPGFVLENADFHNFMALNKLYGVIRHQLKNLQRDNPADLERAAQEIRWTALSAGIPAGLDARIADSYRRLGHEVVTVQSVVTSPDSELPLNSMGYHSFMIAQSEDEVIQAILTCWSSVFESNILARCCPDQLSPESLWVEVAVEQMVTDGQPALPQVYHAGPSVLLAHSNLLMRKGITATISECGFRVLGESDTVAQLFTYLEEHSVDLVLVDQQLVSNGLETIVPLLEAAPHAIVVLLTDPRSSGDFLGAIKAGASGCLSLNLSPQEFVQSLGMLARGDMVVCQGMAESLRTRLGTDGASASSDGYCLTEREREVLTLLAHGSTNREIGKVLIITENTVKVHIRRILDKLNLRNRQQAAAYAVQTGLVIVSQGA